MAITVTKLRDGDQASAGLRGSEHTGRFLVDFGDTSGPTTQLAVMASGIPNVGDSHPGHIGSFVVDKTADYLGKSTSIFVVEVRYSSHLEVPLSDDPISRPIEVTISGIRSQEEMVKDLDGKSVVNSAGSPFDRPPVRDVTRQVMTIVRNEAVFNLETARFYADTLNLFVWFGQAPGTVKMMMPTGVLESIGSTNYVRVTYEMHFSNQPDDDPDAAPGAMKPWDHIDVLDLGLDEWVPFFEPEPGEPLGRTQSITREVVDKEKNVELVPITDPLPLDGNGRALVPVTVVDGGPETMPTELVYLRFRPYRRAPWAALNLLAGQ